MYGHYDIVLSFPYDKCIAFFSNYHNDFNLAKVFKVFMSLYSNYCVHLQLQVEKVNSN
ncbi:hypothetical protein CW3_0538 [Bacteroides xylanisolvens SD CC 1b]|nr:hypothetical protein CW3_0538 [Bacteroides xylanisolvens SD CC 1b]